MEGECTKFLTAMKRQNGCDRESEALPRSEGFEDIWDGRALVCKIYLKYCRADSRLQTLNDEEHSIIVMVKYCCQANLYLVENGWF
jgi:hypothetical protein